MTANATLAKTRSRFLHRFIDMWLVVALGSIALILLVFYLEERREIPYLALGLLAQGLLAKLLLRYDGHWFVNFGILAVFVLPVLLLPFTVNGVRTPALIGWPTLILLAGWLLGRKAAALSTVLAMIVITLLWWMESTGWLTFKVPLRSAEVWWATWIGCLALAGLTVWFVTASYVDLHFQQHALKLQLDAANAQLANQLDQRTSQLQKSDESLMHIRSEYEKAYPMAVMAGVVPSLAHDLNTHVGNSGLAVDTLRDQLTAFQLKVANGLRRSDLDAMLATMNEGLQILKQANARQVELVGSLKQLSVDQATQQRRTFHLATLLDEVLASLSPQLRKNSVKVESDLQVGQSLDSFPGPLGQVMVNLLQNALVHAFEGRQGGTITVSAAKLDAHEFQLTFADNGVGMSEEVLQKIFDPFFTTKAGQGGSGIGLAFSKQLVEQTLGGSLTAESQIGAGSRFVMRLPLIAPQSQAIQA